MSVELNLLLWSVALTIFQMLITVSGTTLKIGIPALVGNRDQITPPQGWIGRARRAHLNMLENLVLFAILVCILELAGTSTPLTVIRANLFFWGRVVYFPLYLFGIPWLRSLAWMTSMAGLILIFHQLV